MKVFVCLSCRIPASVALILILLCPVSAEHVPNGGRCLPGIGKTLDLFSRNVSPTASFAIPVTKGKPVNILGSIIDESTYSGVEAAVDLHEGKAGNLFPGGMTDLQGGFGASLTSGKTYEMLVQMTMCHSASQPESLKYSDLTSQNTVTLSDTTLRTVINGRLVDYRTGKSLRFPIAVTDLKSNAVITRLLPDVEGRFHLELPYSTTFKIEILTTSCDSLRSAELLKCNTSVAENKKITLENVYFDFDRSDIRPDAEKILAKHVALFNRYTEWQIVIGGHTDNMGSEDYNTYISRKRAEAVADYLVAHGVKKSRLQVISFGFDHPVSSAQTDEGRQMNRRCEFSVVKY